MTAARCLTLLLALGLLALPARALVGTESRITETFGWEEQPHIQGDRVVWADASQGESEDIWMYEFDTGRRLRLSSSLSDEQSPHIYGDRVVWRQDEIYEDPNTGQISIRKRIAVHNLLAGQTTLAQDLAAGGFPGGVQQLPVIYGETLVWENNDGGRLDLYAMNLGSGLVLPITNDDAIQTLPYISGNWIAYEEITSLTATDHNTDLWVYNLQTSPPVRARVAGAPEWDELDPTIYGNTLVYSDYRDDPDGRITEGGSTPDDDADLYLVDLSPLLAGQPLGVAQPLVVRAGHQEEPRLFSDRLVWRNFDPAATTADLWTMDLRDREPEVLVDGPADLWEVQIWGDRIVWSDFRDDAYPDDEIHDYNIRAFCIDQDTCGVFPEEIPLLLIAVGVLVVLVAAAAAIALFERRRQSRAAPEAPKARARKRKGKGPQPKRAR